MLFANTVSSLSNILINSDYNYYHIRYSGSVPIPFPFVSNNDKISEHLGSFRLRTIECIFGKDDGSLAKIV